MLNLAEIGAALHNMSAPPMSQVVVAPHRQHRNDSPLVSFYLPLLNQNSWEEDILRRCKLSSLAEVQEQADFWLDQLNPPVAFPMAARVGGISIHPLLSIGILSRTVGSLFMRRRNPILSYSRVSLRVSVVDPKFIARILETEAALKGGSNV